MPYNHKEYMREYNKKNKERLNKQSAEWYAKNKDYQVKYRKTLKGHKIHTISNWKSLGINCNEEWNDLYDWWDNCETCDICDKAFDKRNNKCVDHDHTIEEYNVRGILCRVCNMRDER